MSPRRQHSWDSNTLVLLNVRSRQFTTLYLSGGLYKITIRTDLDLVRKISIKMLSVLMQKLGFRLYEIQFLTKQATPPPLRDRSNLTRSYPSISSSLLRTVLSSLVSLYPITVAFVSQQYSVFHQSQTGCYLYSNECSACLVFEICSMHHC